MYFIILLCHYVLNKEKILKKQAPQITSTVSQKSEIFMKQPPRGEGWKHTYVLYCNICVAKAGYIFLDSYHVKPEGWKIRRGPMGGMNSTWMESIIWK